MKKSLDSTRVICRPVNWAVFVLTASLGLMSVLAAAQDDLLQQLKGPKGGIAKPDFQTTLTSSDDNPDEVTLSIQVKLPKGFYIYATTGEFSGKTRIKTEETGLEPIDDEFTPDREPKVETDPLLDAEVAKFFGEVTWSRKYRVTKAGEAKVSGELTGQYCGGADAENPKCILINPPYKFDVKLKKKAPFSDAVALPSTQHAAPTVKMRGKDVSPIEFDFTLSPPNSQPGDKVTLSIKATLAEGWHTFSLTQDGGGGLPTVIDVSQLSGLKPLGEGFVADPKFEIEVQADLPLEVHNHAVTWTRQYEVTEKNYRLAGEISYQTCKNVCLPVKKVVFEVGAGEPNAAQPPKVAVNEPEAGPPQPDPAVGPVPPRDNPKPPAAPRSLLPFLVVCFLGGFGALLTPCSFPMVPITVSFFLKQSEAQHKRPVLLALVYCGTIVAAFTILGVGIAAFFGAFQLNALANIPWINFVIGSVFVLFALNMLGVFEIQMPGWLLTMTASKESAGSYLGAVFMALTFTLTSFTCTFAIAGGLLMSAAQGEVYWPVIGMLAFGTAFASPFFVLAMVPGLLKKMPKSGGWMNSVKVVMGLLELGAAVKFFSIADPAQVFFDHVTVMLIWFVLAIVTAIYLFGWFKLPHDTMTTQISPWGMLLGIGFFVLAGLLLTGVALPDRGGFAVQQILAFAPVRIEAGAGNLGPTLNHHGLEFALYFDKAQPIAEKQNRPLLLDFTGVNCANCRFMEKRMALPEWKERIAKFIGVQLYVDVPQIPTIHNLAEGKRLQAENIKLQDELVQDPSMPGYAVVTPDGKTVLATYIGSETKAGTFVQFLDDGWAKWEQFKAKGGQANGKLTERGQEPLH